MTFDTLADAIDYCIDHGPHKIVRVIKTQKLSVVPVGTETPWATTVVERYAYPMTTTDWLLEGVSHDEGVR